MCCVFPGSSRLHQKCRGEACGCAAMCLLQSHVVGSLLLPFFFSSEFIFVGWWPRIGSRARGEGLCNTAKRFMCLAMQLESVGVCGLFTFSVESSFGNSR